MLETRRIAMCIIGELALTRHLDDQLSSEFYKDDIGGLVKIIDEGLQRGLKECDQIAMFRLIIELQGGPEPQTWEFRNIGARAKIVTR